jgi:N-acyl-D-amino-acid deacylase
MRKLALVLVTSLALSAFNFTLAQAPAEYDIVITNARIIDGTGNPWFRGEIGIRGGRITKIGHINPQLAGSTGTGPFTVTAKTIIDAKNQIVAPGFIDVHAHTEDIFSHPDAENFVRMGVTSLITGNCGGCANDVPALIGRESGRGKGLQQR